MKAPQNHLISVLVLLMISIQFLSIVSAEVVPYRERWGIYVLDPTTSRVSHVYSTSQKITTFGLNSEGDALVFSQRIDGDEDADEEICTIGVDGTGFRRLTNNDHMDVYPAWSPDGSKIAFLSWPSETLDIYVMDSDGGDQKLLYDSGFHDADIHWREDKIAFTRNSQIWIMDDDGTDATQLTAPRELESGGTQYYPSATTTPASVPTVVRSSSRGW